LSLSAVLRAFRRRWYLALIGVLVTAALGVAALHLVSPKYQSKAVVLLLPPKDATAHNPYLNLSSLTGLSDVLDQAVTAELQDLGLTFTIASEQTATAGPLIRITGEAATPAQAQRTARYVISLVPTTLRRLQSSAGVEANAFITSVVLNPVNRTVAVRTKQTRALIVAVAAGLLLTVFVVVATDDLLNRRQRKREGASGPTAVTPTGPTPVDKVRSVHPAPKKAAGGGTNGARQRRPKETATGKRPNAPAARAARDEVTDDVSDDDAEDVAPKVARRRR
jgi:capsular polysaccharide biosynthesis protein